MIHFVVLKYSLVDASKLLLFKIHIPRLVVLNVLVATIPLNIALVGRTLVAFRLWNSLSFLLPVLVDDVWLWFRHDNHDPVLGSLEQVLLTLHLH